MVTDEQYRRLMKLLKKERTLMNAADKAGMDEKTARKWRDVDKSPSEVKVEHAWRTRRDPFEDVWDKVKEYLEVNPGLEAKTLFEALQRKYPGRFSDGQIRTLQRRIKIWRALYGPPKEVYFPQKHTPGVLSQSDFTHMKSLSITIAGELFPHLIYHFVLTYSNWEAGSICFSESFEALSEGLQNALFELGGIPKEHQTDRLSTAVNKMDHPEEFTQRYQALLNYYGMTGRKIQAGKPHENGDIEQRHYRFKKALDQALMLRGSRDFKSRKEYEKFLKELFKQLNAGRKNRLEEELEVMGRLPKTSLDICKRTKVRVGPSSTIRASHNTYSVHSRLIGEAVDVRIYASHIDIWYAQRCIERLPRLRGEDNYLINYRHIIDWLVRKPAAFENYRYREALFPTTNFRIAYDLLKEQSPMRANKEYLHILYLAAYEGETQVNEALKCLIENEAKISKNTIKEQLSLGEPPLFTDVAVDAVELETYDTLLCQAVV